MKKTLKQNYDIFKSDFESLQEEVYLFVKTLVEREDIKTDISNIYKRKEIKNLQSIEKNYTAGHYKNISFWDIDDIAGIRIICHCEDDIYALEQRLKGELLQKKYLQLKVDTKGGKGSEYPYRATHITFAKNIKKNERLYQIFCEIQIRTVMADAWAIQNHKYLYKKIEEGETNELTSAVSEIMNGCEKLWSLVKKKSTGYQERYTKRDIGIVRKKSETSLKSTFSNADLEKWFKSHKEKSLRGLQKLGIKTSMEIEAQLLDSDMNITKSKMREGARKSQVRTSGWPIGVFFDDDKYAPKPDQEGIYAEISIRERLSYDYWAIHKSVALYLNIGLPDLFFDAQILRITEVFMYIKNLCINFNVPMNKKIQVMIKHDGLKGRILRSSSPLRPLFNQYKTEVEKSPEVINVTLEEIESDMTDIVEKFTTPLFEQFNFFNLKKTTLHKIVSDYLQGKFPY